MVICDSYVSLPEGNQAECFSNMFEYWSDKICVSCVMAQFWAKPIDSDGFVPSFLHSSLS